MKRYGFAAAILGCALALPVLAQQDAGPFFNTFNGVNPRNISMQVPASTSRAMRSMNMRSLQSPKAGLVTPNINSHFPRTMSLGTWPPKVPEVFILKKSPYQPNPPKGNSFLDLLFKKSDTKK